ncbi:GatB/YqeY domain-containing protein [Glonium stellatum]|uniref:Altered inheritance of mitochondria protein 41 n=1 Tax=Glonium stellatum TaxID=574774 RepID=A0A8E2EPP0_9PEZI|nr:GatB/YqeY domain-containing protein [Glonium stellatum]
MASLSRPLFRLYARTLRPSSLHSGYRCRIAVPIYYRCLSSTPPNLSSSVLTQLRNDLKTAMRNKDTARLSVLRAVLAEITNASKTNSPIANDLQLLALLRKRIGSAQSAAAEFLAANRLDLATKEDKQIAVMEEYAGSVKTVGQADIKDAVEGAIRKLKAGSEKLDLGSVLKSVTGSGGELEGKPVEKKEVVRIVKEMLESA